MPLPSLLKSLPLVWGKVGKVRGPEKNHSGFTVVKITGERETAETYLLHGTDQYSVTISSVSPLVLYSLTYMGLPAQ